MSLVASSCNMKCDTKRYILLKRNLTVESVIKGGYRNVETPPLRDLEFLHPPAFGAPGVSALWWVV